MEVEEAMETQDTANLEMHIYLQEELLPSNAISATFLQLMENFRKDFQWVCKMQTLDNNPQYGYSHRYSTIFLQHNSIY